MAKTENTPTATLAEAALVMTNTSSTIDPLKEGDVARFSAVHGDIYHPWDNTRFTQDSEVKHVVDSWINLQYTNGKLKLVVD